MSRFFPYGDLETAEARSREMLETIRGGPKPVENTAEFLYRRQTRVDAELPPGVEAALLVPGRDIFGYLDRLVREDALTQEEMIRLVGVYPDWATATPYAIGDIAEYNLQLWKCIQAHTSQVDWFPAAVPALWQPTVPAGVIPIWDSGLVGGYALDDLVIWPEGGKVWRSLTDANAAFEPGGIGTWRDQTIPPIWVAPAGSVGLWQVDDVAEHEGQVWICTSPNNAFEPGVFGWVVYS